MRCIFCMADDTSVVDSRSNDETSYVRRRRECSSCKKRFTTYERPEVKITVVKKDGRKEDFRREKIADGVKKACEKRGISPEDVENFVLKIEGELAGNGEREIEAHKVGEQIMKNLRNLDKVAYLRFASVYKSFNDVSQFLDEVKDLALDEKNVPEKED
ncbi:MAG: transcriptional regulator NrdR [Candidatus Dadabacteria bacterium]|nr:transcriptional regulator NrdR [Candidatus Dadabacteria bacterium]MCY4046745.1 transcriptional regulator NrdR [Candidatus Dadabacteria bacterium]